MASLGYGAALGRVRRGRLFPAILIGIAGALMERAAIAGAPDLAIPLTWLTVVAAGTIAVTLAWTVATSTFDARQAKRLFPLCTAAAIAGNFLGALAAGPVAGLVGTESLIVAEALLLTVGALVIWRLAAPAPTPAWGAPSGVRRPVVADLRAGFDEVRRAPLLGLIAVAYVLLAVLLLFDVPIPRVGGGGVPGRGRACRRDRDDLGDRHGGLVRRLSGARRPLLCAVRRGIHGAAPAARLYLAGFGVWIVSFTFATAALVQASVQVTQRGLRTRPGARSTTRSRRTAEPK